LRSSSLSLPGVVDAERRPGIDLEALDRNLLAAFPALAVRAVRDARERAVDLREHLARVLAERVVDLPVERRGRRLTEVVVVERPRALFHLVVERAGMAVAEVRDRSLHALAFLQQLDAEMLGVDGHRRESFLGGSSVAEADVSRRSANAGAIPSSSTILSLPVCPETSVTAARGTSSVSARRRTTAAFARPFSGGCVTRTFHASPCRPTIAGRPAPGLTRRRSRVIHPVYSRQPVRQPRPRARRATCSAGRP